MAAQHPKGSTVTQTALFHTRCTELYSSLTYIVLRVARVVYNHYEDCHAKSGPPYIWTPRIIYFKLVEICGPPELKFLNYLKYSTPQLYTKGS